jgi:diadenylate cyclase
MHLPDRLSQLFQRIQTYPAWQVVLEIGIIWLVVYAVVRFVQGTRAAGALKGILLLIVLATLIVRIVGQREAFHRLTFLYQTFLPLAAFSLVVIFQPELRRGIIRLGEAQLFRRAGVGVGSVVDAVVEACQFLSKAKFGAIIVLERESSLRGLVEGGTPIDGKVTPRLLQTIFFPGSALHDLAVIISGADIKAAGVQLPLADPEDMPDPSLGSRHRAAVGLSKESDALVVVVSEERGTISLAERGQLIEAIAPDKLREMLLARLHAIPSDVPHHSGDETLELPRPPADKVNGHARPASRAAPGLRDTPRETESS